MPQKEFESTRFTDEELITTLAEVEMVLNSRPPTYMLCEDLEEPHTPSHLLHGRRIMRLSDHLFDDSDEDFHGEVHNNRLKYFDRTLNSFWKRCRKEYLLELREAHRHYRSNGTPQIVVRDIVVVYADDQPRRQWKLGLIEQVIIGADSEVRAASVRVNKKGKPEVLRSTYTLWRSDTL